MASPQGNHLSPEQTAHFMTHGFLRLSNCFTRTQAADWTAQVWTRLGWDPYDKSTWAKERVNMPKHRTVRVADFAPKAWDAICELVGGEDRIDDETKFWGDSLIVNVGTPEFEGKEVHPRELVGWHVDGDFFVHYLDSREQGLLVIPLFTDIEPAAGGTVVCSDGMGKIARHLHDHPEGVMPRMTPRGASKQHEADLSFYNSLVQTCSEFHEMTGSVGDVVLLHPLMLHSASRNQKRNLRIIINPRVSLREPFQFDRPEGDEFSWVEKKTLQLLGVERLPDWKATGPREEVVPERVRIQARMLQEEKERLGKITQSVTTTEVTAAS